MQAVRDGEAVAICNTQTDPRTDAEVHAAYNIYAYITVPFFKAGELKYLFTVNDATPRDWRADEIELIREVTSRVFPRLERARAEAALRVSEEKFRTLANTAPALILHNNAQGENLFLNQYFLDYTCKSAEEIHGTGWHNLVHPDEAETYIADYLAAVQEQRAWNNRCRIRRHEVMVAHNGRQGITLARSFRPEVLLCDIGLPGMDGYEVARTFRADEELKQVYLVSITGYARPEDLKRAREAGFHCQLAKPVDPNTLKQTLAKLTV